MSGGAPGSSDKRPWVAVLLAVLYPGLGHVYLRRWGRALLWTVLFLASTTVLVPQETRPESLSVEAVVTAVQAIPPTVTVALLALNVLNVVDAYLLAKRSPAGAGTDAAGAERCPNCGKDLDLDEDLEFCHWCTTDLTESDGDGDGLLSR